MTSVDDRRLHDIYRMRDLSGRLLYVGVTNGGLRRFMEHSKDKTWWREVTQIDVEHVHCSRSVIEMIEREAIQAEAPLYNVAHNRTTELPTLGDGALPTWLEDHPMSDARPTASSPIDPKTGRAALGGRVRRSQELEPRRLQRQCDVVTSFGQQCRNPVRRSGDTCASHSHLPPGYAYLPDSEVQADGGRVFGPTLRDIDLLRGGMPAEWMDRVNDAVRLFECNPDRYGFPTVRRACLVIAVTMEAYRCWETEEDWNPDPMVVAGFDLLEAIQYMKDQYRDALIGIPNEFGKLLYSAAGCGIKFPIDGGQG